MTSIIFEYCNCNWIEQKSNDAYIVQKKKTLTYDHKPCTEFSIEMIAFEMDQILADWLFLSNVFLKSGRMYSDSSYYCSVFDLNEFVRDGFQWIKLNKAAICRGLWCGFSWKISLSVSLLVFLLTWQKLRKLTSCHQLRRDKLWGGE